MYADMHIGGVGYPSLTLPQLVLIVVALVVIWWFFQNRRGNSN